MSDDFGNDYIGLGEEEKEKAPTAVFITFFVNASTRFW